jgi:hypothetical protein
MPCSASLPRLPLASCVAARSRHAPRTPALFSRVGRSSPAGATGRRGARSRILIALQESQKPTALSCRRPATRTCSLDPRLRSAQSRSMRLCVTRRRGRSTLAPSAAAMKTTSSTRRGVAQGLPQSLTRAVLRVAGFQARELAALARNMSTLPTQSLVTAGHSCRTRLRESRGRLAMSLKLRGRSRPTTVAVRCTALSLCTVKQPALSVIVSFLVLLPFLSLAFE